MHKNPCIHRFFSIFFAPHVFLAAEFGFIRPSWKTDGIKRKMRWEPINSIAKPLHAMCFLLRMCSDAKRILASETRTRRDFSIRSQILILVSDVKHQKRDRAISLLMFNIRNEFLLMRKISTVLVSGAKIFGTVGRAARHLPWQLPVLPWRVPTRGMKLIMPRRPKHKWCSACQCRW